MFGSPDLPPPPSSPPPPSTTDASEAAGRERLRQQRARGRRSTIYAGGQSPVMTAEAQPTGKPKLGS